MFDFFRVCKNRKIIIIILCIVIAIIVFLSVLINEKKENILPILYAHTNGAVCEMTYEEIEFEDNLNDFPFYYTKGFSDSIVFDNKGARNINLILSTSGKYNGFNKSKLNNEDKVDFKIISVERYFDGEREVLTNFKRKGVYINLKNEGIYYFKFIIRFDEYDVNYYLKIQKIDSETN